MARTESIDLGLGDPVYAADGVQIGTVRGVDDSGVYVATDEHVGAPHPSRHGTTLGEFDLMWRCWECGEMGRIDDMPDSCPSCGASAEELYYWTED